MIKSHLQNLTNHQYVEITSRGNSAIQAAFSLVEGTILIPAEGGWLSYKKAENYEEVKCDDSKINLADLKQRLRSKPSAFIYQNPGGYFAEQPMEEIYKLCKENNCLVIIDVSGAIGTKLCDGNYADILVCSFGRWKLVNAEAGGFISFKDEEVYEKAKCFIDIFDDENSLKKIKEKLINLQQRIAFLKNKRKTILKDLENFDLVRAGDLGFVVIVKFTTGAEKENLINYCKDNSLEYTECPRYIRINQKAISIEVKRLS